jgi:Na+/melibiose symporter-like transporter
MERSEYRIIFSTIAVFFSIAGMAAVIHGMLFDESNVTRYGVTVIVLGVISFALLLNKAGGSDV